MLSKRLLERTKDVPILTDTELPEDVARAYADSR